MAMLKNDAIYLFLQQCTRKNGLTRSAYWSPTPMMILVVYMEVNNHILLSINLLGSPIIPLYCCVDYVPYANGQVLHCEVDSKSNLKDLFSSKDGVMLIDTQRKERSGLVNSEDSGSVKTLKLDRAYLSFNGVKVDTSEHDDKTSETILKSVLPALVPTLSVSNKMHNAETQSQRKSATIIRLSITQKSIEEETNEFCK